MQYTGNVNKFLWYFVIPFLLCFYIIFVFIENNYLLKSNAYEITEHKMASLRSTDTITGIILGGSNALYGLSASTLSQLSEQQWFNLALIAEGYSDENYWNFVHKSLTNEQRLEISHVIYSSSTPLSGSLREEGLIDLGGNQKLSFRPQYSLASYIKQLLMPSLSHPMPDNYGDFSFDDYDCYNVSVKGQKFFSYLPEDDLIWWISKQINKIKLLFPNATILIELPNAFQANNFDYVPMEEMVSILNTTIEKYKQDSHASIYFSIQDPYPEANLMCNDSWHANKFGRNWRTGTVLSKTDFWIP